MSADTNPRRIMIVDDDPLFRRGLRQLVARFDNLSVVAEAADGVAAIQVAKQVQPAIVLVDYQMPKVNGAETIRKLAGVLPGATIFGVSAHVDRKVAAAMTQAGAVEVFAKTDNLNELLRLLQEFVE